MSDPTTNDFIIATVTSGIAFKANYEKILSDLLKSPTSYIPNFLKCVETILLAQDSTPTSRFYSLFLLLKATEVEQKHLASELSQHKDLLNQLYLDAQFDIDKPLHEKGNKFFSPKPMIEDSIVGNNYIRLVLESIQSWSEKYGSPDKKHPGNIYHMMFASLKKVKFPPSYHYANSTANITPDFYLKQDFEDQEKAADQAAITIKAFMQVTSCISSGAEYKLNSKPVFDSVAENSSVYCDSLLDTITEVLESKDYSPKSKFYALYLLIQVTETQNKVFLTRFAHRKGLLTKFAQVVLNDCGAKGRGERLFPELFNTPDAIIGKNYITLLLEAIKFWDAAFGSSDINSPFNAFRTLDSSIWKFVDFPNKYFYVGQDLDPEGDEMGKSLSVYDPVSLIPDDLLNNDDHNRPHGLNPAVARDHVNECISSGEAFRHTFEVILDALQTESQEYIQLYLQTITEVISSPRVPPLSKFYALYLLAKSTEYTNESLVVLLGGASKDLLNKIFQDAQVNRTNPLEERGATLYAKDPNPVESMIGKCSLRLILEALIFWDENFGNDAKGNPGHMFRAMMSSLSKMNMQFPDEYIYIGSEVDILTGDLEERLQRLGYVPQQGKPKEQSAAGFDLGLLVKSLAKMNENKISLRHLLENNTSETSKIHESLPGLIDTINIIYTNDVEPHMQGLLKDNNPTVQKYVTDIFTEGELVDGLNAEFSYFTQKRTNYLQFRNAVLKLLKEHDIGTSNSRLPGSNDDLSNRQSQRLRDQPSNKPDPFELRPEEMANKQVQQNPAIASQNSQPAISVNNKPVIQDPTQSRILSQSLLAQSPEKPVKAENGSVGMRSPQDQERGARSSFKSSPQKDEIDLDMTKSKIPKNVLRASLNEIAQSIVFSKALQSQMMESKRAGMNAGPIEPLDHIKRKSRLEDDVSKLRRKKMELAKEAGQGEPRDRGDRERNEESQMIVNEHERKIEEMERRLNDTQRELARKMQEIENLKREQERTSSTSDDLMKKALEENSQLNETVRYLTEELEFKMKDSPDKKENEELKWRLQQVGGVKRTLEDDLNSLQARNNELYSKAEMLKNAPPPVTTTSENTEFIKKSTKPFQVTARVYGRAPVPLGRRNRTRAQAEEKQKEDDGEYIEPKNDPRASARGVREEFVGHKEEERSEQILERVPTPNWKDERAKKISFGVKSPIFKDLEGSLDTENLLNFKLSCLKNKSVLYESNMFKVGMTSVLLPDYSTKKKLQKIILYYANSTGNTPITDFYTTFDANPGIQCVLEPEVVQTHLPPNVQVKQQFLCLIQELPYYCPQINGSLDFRGNQHWFLMKLPCLITKYMDFKHSTLQNFASKYLAKSQDILQTETIKLNRDLIKTGNDFKKYFEYLIDLDPNNEYDFIQEKATLDFGGVFELDALGVEYYMKIKVSPSLSATFLIAASPKSSESVKLVLESLVFLFQA